MFPVGEAQVPAVGRGDIRTLGMAAREDRHHGRAGTTAAGTRASRIGRHLPGEARLAALFTLLSFFAVGLPRVFTNAAASTLFLQAYGAQALPYTYVAAALAVPAV